MRADPGTGLRPGVQPRFLRRLQPERINPGDKQHRVTNILKVTSGSTPEAADFVDALYRSIITAGTHKATSIKVAEAAKVIENTQRDVNIALINELALIFNKLGIDTLEVLEAAGTKWNFLPFRPGLVGGHCIGVDPYYLTHKAQEIGYHPEVILAGRRINDGMGAYVATQAVRLMARKRINPVGAQHAGAGPGLQGKLPRPAQHPGGRHHRQLNEYHAEVDVYDPWVDAAEAEHEYGIRPIGAAASRRVRRRHPRRGACEFGSWARRASAPSASPAAVVFDVKYVLPRDAVDGRL